MKNYDASIIEVWMVVFEENEGKEIGLYKGKSCGPEVKLSYYIGLATKCLKIHRKWYEDRLVQINRETAAAEANCVGRNFLLLPETEKTRLLEVKEEKVALANTAQIWHRDNIHCFSLFETPEIPRSRILGFAFDTLASTFYSVYSVYFVDSTCIYALNKYI